MVVMNKDSLKIARLTEDPSWSPDGKRIAFSADRRGDLENYEIYVMDADGGNEQRLTENRETDKWTPHGPPMASTLPSILIGMETLKSM